MNPITRETITSMRAACVLWTLCFTVVSSQQLLGQDTPTSDRMKALIEQSIKDSLRHSNAIDFDAWATNKYVTSNIAFLQTGLRHGTPNLVAVLVDSTNFDGATWSTYTSSNVLVNLGPKEGWHEIRVGMRATQDSDPTWVWTRLKLDRTPPTITVTKPASSTVSQPMIQLQGCSSEDLESLSCNVSNAVGAFHNAMIFVLDRDFDPDAFEFTTNWFQAFDLRLSTNLNTIKIRATDKAGNSSTTNFSITLVCDSVAPVLELWWPQDGAELCGEDFTWRGLVDDFTATLTAESVGTNGTTSVRTALVERDGKFWFENLPLAEGVTRLKLAAADFWGNVSTTNISVRRSEVQLTIDPLGEITLTDATVTVTGSINVSDHTVWVNGIKAALNRDGTWSAHDVPVNPGGTAVIQARAIPNSDNGGNGTGSSGGSGATMQDSGNPTSRQQKNAEGRGAPDGE